jgi:hypothetical protein
MPGNILSVSQALVYLILTINMKQSIYNTQDKVEKAIFSFLNKPIVYKFEIPNTNEN